MIGMLIGFTVGNFLSFEEIQRFTMVPSDDSDHQTHVVNKGNLRILKGALIYGSNAAGKSNFVKSIDFSKKASTIRIPSDCKKCCHGYSNKVTKEMPAYFEFLLEINGNCYSYGFEINLFDSSFLTEWLFQIMDDGSELLIFNINNVDGVRSIDCNESWMESLFIEYNKSNRTESYLKYHSENTSDEKSHARMVFDWIKYSLIIKTNEHDDQIMVLKEQYLSKDMMAYASILDTGIKDIKFVPINGIVSEHDFFKSDNYDDMVLVFDNDGRKSSDVYPDFKTRFRKSLFDSAKSIANVYGQCVILSNNILFYVRKDSNGDVVYHKILFKHGLNAFDVEYYDESHGTKRMIDVLCNYDSIVSTAGNVPKHIESGKTLIVDEFECSIHTLATIELLKIFYNRPNNGCDQLIATTHESKLISTNYLRRDEIWFMESNKNGHDRNSVLYPLSSFDDSEEKHLDLAYLEGRYGAIPVLKDMINKREESC